MPQRVYSNNEDSYRKSFPVKNLAFEGFCYYKNLILKCFISALTGTILNNHESGHLFQCTKN